MEDVHLVASRHHAANVNLAAPVGNRIVRRIYRNHHRAHLWMNVAKDVRDSRLVELHKLRASAFVQAEIETLSVEQRKHIVKKRIVIRKLNLPARWNYQQGRMKALIFLQ